MASLLWGICGGVLLTWGIAISCMTNPNAGNAMTVLLGAALLIYAAFRKKLNEILPRWIRIAVCVCAALALALMLFLYAYGRRDTVTYQEDAIIVLGAGLRGEEPTMTLAKRLAVAARYLEKNPSAIIVVSGGQGENEIVSEAYAMAKYLERLGVDPANIVQEDRSTSTSENFRFSKAILDKMFPGGYSCAYVTTDFHAFRAGALARKAGLNPTRISSNLTWYMVPMNYLREILGVAQMVVLGK